MANTTDDINSPVPDQATPLRPLPALPALPALPPPKPGLPGTALPPGASDLPRATSDGVMHFSLLLPLLSESFASAANAVRAGFMAAYEQEKEGVIVNVIETSDVPKDVLSSYNAAVATSDVIIGPLTRSCAAAIAQDGMVRIPTISLTQSDVENEVSTHWPPLMMSMGLSVEDEARQAASWIAANKQVHKVFVASTSVAWQRRAAKAFAAKAGLLGMEVQSVELGSAGGYLSAADLAQLKRQAQDDKPGVLFAALDAAQARQLHGMLGSDIVIYGTSQLNPRALPDWATGEREQDMNGVRLLDVPWQLQADHPAVMIYPHMVIPADQKRSADMERLYALGIDAFRVARLVAAQHKQFAIDGVTGRLSAIFNKDSVYFERIEPYAIYRDGAVTYLSEGH